MAASPPITLTWETDPVLLTDNVGSELYVDVNADSKLAISCKTALRGVQPAGVPDTCRFKYGWLLLPIA